MTEAPVTKPSGSFWTGDIPADWSEPNFRYVASIRNGSDYKEFQVEEGGYPVIGSGGAFARTSKYLHDGESVLLGRKGTVDKPLYVNGRFWTVDTMFYTNIGHRVLAKFLYYFATTIPFDYFQTSTAVPSMTQGDLGSIKVPLPGLERQRETVRFLDRETAQIDELIDKQERLIELLAEKRQAIITHAVTKGLDPAAPTKSSGIPWLGEVPSHWTVPQLGMHAKVGNGSTPNRDTAEYWSGGEIPWLNSSHVNREQITDADQFVSEAATAECHLPLVEAESLLIGLTGQGRTRGMTSILRFPATINQHVAYVTPEKSVWNPEYLLWFLRSSYDRLRELSDENGSTKGALTCSAIKKLNIALPPLSEQDAIAAYISEQLASIDRIVAASTATVELLRERRSTLISAAVTGTIDVRKEAP